MRLKLLLFNVQDLFLRLAFPIGSADLEGLSEVEWAQLAPRDQPLKPLFKLRGLAAVVRAEQPDLIMVCEAGGLESLANFSRLFLADEYQALATPGISERGIDTGFLLRRGLRLAAQLLSHADEPVSFRYPHEVDPAGHEVTAAIASTLDLGLPESRRLSRDIPELRLFEAGATQPSLVVLLAHLKSPLDYDGIDPGGAARRAGEVRTLLKIRDGVRQDLGEGVPIVLAGDFNGRAARPETAPEFAPIYQETDVVDVLELACREPHERITQITYFLDEGHATQLDYIFLPKALHGALDVAQTFVHRYRFAEGDGEVQLPGSLRDRRLLPSDHYPVVCVLVLSSAISSASSKPQT